MPRKSEDIELKKLAIAYLIGEGKSQADIVKLLNLSQSTVNRFYQSVKDEYLQMDVRFRVDKVSAETLRRIRQLVSRPELETQLDHFSWHSAHRPGPVVRVFQSGNLSDSSTRTPEEWQARLARFGQEAAGYVKTLLHNVQGCGVTWGGTLFSLVEGMSGLPMATPRRAKPLDFIPLCGEPAGKEPTRYSSSTLASRLYEIFNGNDGPGHTLSLAAVPMFIPPELTPDEGLGVWKLISYAQAYIDIFGKNGLIDYVKTYGEALGKPYSRKDIKAYEDLLRTHELNANGQHDGPWVEQLDAILTSVGFEQRPLGLRSDSFRVTGLKAEALHPLVLFDIAGILIPRPALSEKDRQKVERINKRATGIREEALRQCVGKATDSRSPGVIVAAIGDNKARFVFEAVKLGFVQHLVIDEELEEALKQLCQNEAQT